MLTSILLFLALVMSIFCVARVLNGVAITHSGGSHESMSSLPGTVIMTAALWALLYYVTH